MALSDKFSMPKVLQNMNLFISGKGYAGRVSEITLPKLTIKTEEYSAGGMDLPLSIDMGMEKLECSFTVHECNKNIFDWFELNHDKKENLIIRGAMDQGGQVHTVEIVLSGGFKELDMGGWKPGDKAATKIQAALRYYKLTIGSEVLAEVDVVNMKRIINGKDKLKDIRKAIGLS
ncbi:phage major tail tube protein [Spartinivicinus marinus]|nr:phage major tail tube protein [Spartinivicinus marinus]MCX4026611.1 phage major tail tube protein [Spartinivicinus marinus]